MTYKTKLASIIIAAAALSATTGCTTTDLEEGDYMVFRVAFSSSTPEANCYQKGEIPASIKEDSTSLLGGGTYIMYATEVGGYFLDAGSTVLAGELDVDTYEFRGDITDVEVPVGTTIFDADHDGIDDSMDDAIDADGDGIDDQQDDLVDVDNDGLDDRFEDNLVDANNDGVDDRIVEVPAPHKFRSVRDYRVDMVIANDVVTGETRTTLTNTCEGTDCPEDYNTQCRVTGTFEGVVIEDAQVDVSLGGPTESSTP